MAIVTLGRTVVDVGDTFVDDCRVIMKVVVKFTFVQQLRMFRVFGFKLYRHLEVRLCVNALIDFSKGTFV